MKRIFYSLLPLLAPFATISADNAAPEGKAVGIVAHRGYWNCEAGGRARNSLAAFKAAHEAGFWGTEFDVCMTADGPVSLEMEKYFQRTGGEMMAGMKAQRVLELNPDSAAFAALSRAVESDRDKAARYAKLLYAQAQLIAGLPLEDPAGYTDLVCGLMK